MMFKKYYLLLTLSLFFLTGCSDMVEIQERDFVLALGVSWSEDEYQFYFALPDLDNVSSDYAGNENRLIRTYTDNTFAGVEKQYNLNSENQLDYRHLQAIILDETLGTVPEKLESFISYINDNNEVSRSALVFYYDGQMKDIFETESYTDGNLGDYLQKLTKNNNNNTDITAVTTGNLIDSSYSGNSLTIPALTLKDGGLSMDGSIVIKDNLFQTFLSQEETDLADLLHGYNKDYIIELSEDYSFQLRDVSGSMHYSYKDSIPSVRFEIKGNAELVSEPSDASTLKYSTSVLNDWLKTQLTEQLTQHLKTDFIDYLNLYSASSYKNRDIWLAYQNKEAEFLEDITLSVTVNFSTDS